jgi:hypothetical protein
MSILRLRTALYHNMPSFMSLLPFRPRASVLNIVALSWMWDPYDQRNQDIDSSSGEF